jgi:hypothetical protein
MKADAPSIQREALFEAVLDTVSDAITVIDKDLRVLCQNEAVQKLCDEAPQVRPLPHPVPGVAKAPFALRAHPSVARDPVAGPEA